MCYDCQMQLCILTRFDQVYRHPIAEIRYGQARDRQLSREAGFDHHFVKPVSVNKIQEVIERAAANGG